MRCLSPPTRDISKDGPKCLHDANTQSYGGHVRGNPVCRTGSGRAFDLRGSTAERDVGVSNPDRRHTTRYPVVRGQSSKSGVDDRANLAAASVALKNGRFCSTMVAKGRSPMADRPVNRPRSPLRQQPTRGVDWSRTISGASGTVTPLRRADAQGKHPMTEIDLPVHPSAALFPLLPPDELDELAESIRENGLQDPIVMQRGVMLDGRNRYAACKLAKVEPTVTEFEGDANAYIIAANINRRHMNAGQRAMAVAMIRPEANRGGRGKTNQELEGFAPSRISEARVVLKHTPAAAALVLQGSKPLASAAAEARSMRDAKKWYEREIQRLSARRADTRKPRYRRRGFAPGSSEARRGKRQPASIALAGGMS